MSDRTGDDTISCSFCGRTADQVATMVTAPDPQVYICDKCINDAVGIIHRDPDVDYSPRPTTPSKWSQSRRRLLTPRQIKESLDEYVIGQDHAKKTLAVAVYNHYKRIDPDRYVHQYEDVELEKSNVLLIGPSGVGKTLLARTLARILDVPFSISDATALTEAGYVGDDVESILSHMLNVTDFDVEQAQQGIIYIDEIDKITRKSDNASITRDVSGEGVQQAPAEDAGGNGIRRAPEGWPETPRAEPDQHRHAEHPLHRRRRLRGLAGDRSPPAFGKHHGVYGGGAEADGPGGPLGIAVRRAG